MAVKAWEGSTWLDAVGVPGDLGMQHWHLYDMLLALEL